MTVSVLPAADPTLRTGTFAEPIVVAAPDELVSLNAGQAAKQLIDVTLIEFESRFFLRAWAGLPLSPEPASRRPLAYALWVEISAEQRDAIRLLHERFVAACPNATNSGDLPRASEARDERLFLHATLACDWPGFNGSRGAGVSVVYRPLEGAGIIRCSDDRIAAAASPGRSCGDELARLYRVAFGGPAALRQAGRLGWHLRQATREALAAATGRSVGVREIPVPPPAAGLHLPAQVAHVAPRDTGEPAVLATLGNAEGMRPGERVELLTAFTDPDETLIESFGQLAYWSRLAADRFGSGRLREGLVLRGAGGIPGSRGLTHWLLCRPELVGELAWPQPEFEGERLRFLYALPVSELEAQLAGAEGVETLLELFAKTGVDPRDPWRLPLPLEAA